MRAEVKVLMVDDHPLMRSSVISAVNARAEGMFSIREAGSGPEALSVYTEFRPDVVLCDISLGSDMTGIELTQRIVSTDPLARVVILSTQDSSEAIQTSFAAGAVGYVHKGVLPDQLVRYLQDAADGKQVLDQNLAAAAINLFRGPAPAPQPSVSLRVREQEILLLLCAEVSTDKEIADSLCIAPNTVKTHMNRLLENLAVPTRTAAVARAWRLGLVTMAEVEKVRSSRRSQEI